tara:strand:- start:143 stop:790 length:648 start_codon:yes stop_codon:yes gene_type:complete
MDDFIIELEWSDDLNLMRQMCIDLYNITPNLVTNLPRSDYFKEVFEKNHAYWRARMWNKISLGPLLDRKEFNEWKRLIEKFKLYGDILFFVTCPEITPLFVPHRHPAESPYNFAGALMLPLIGTDERSITKYAHWHDPEDNKFIDSYNYIKGRPEQTQIPDDEVALEYCLHEKPAIFNRQQFHEVYNPTDSWRVVAHIVYNTESWEECKELSLIR